MIKVCHIIMGHYRNDPRVLKKECTSLAKNGYDVTLLCADGMKDEIIDDVKIVSIKKMFKNRMEQFFKGIKFFLQDALKINADIYHIHEPGLLSLAAKLKKMGKKVIFDSHEDTPMDIKGKKYIPFGFRTLASKIYAAKEKRTVKKLDAVVTVTPLIVKRFQKINPRAYLITNYPKYEEYEIKTKYEDRLPAICFAGIVVGNWNIKECVQAIETFDVKFIIAKTHGDEGYLEEIQKLPAFNKIKIYENIDFKKVVSDVYSNSTIGMCLLNYDICFGGKEGTLGNTKLFEYMMMGLPIVCTDFNLWKEIVEKEECGICVVPNDVEQMRKAIQYLLENKDKAKQMGQNGKRLVQTVYNWQEQEKKLLQLYKDITE